MGWSSSSGNRWGCQSSKCQQVWNSADVMRQEHEYFVTVSQEADDAAAEDQRRRNAVAHTE